MDYSKEIEKNNLNSSLNNLNSSKITNVSNRAKLQAQRDALVTEMKYIFDLKDDIGSYDMSRNGYWQGKKEDLAECGRREIYTNITNYYDECDDLKREIDAALLQADSDIASLQSQINTTNAKIAAIDLNS